MSTKRTDCHRPGAIIPDDYEPVVFYGLATMVCNFPVPPFNIDRVIEEQAAAHRAGRRIWGCIGQCGVCHSYYKVGELWRHKPTGDLLHIGHICAPKYELLGDWAEAECERAIVVERTLRGHRREAMLAMAEEYLDGVPGLREAFNVENGFIRAMHEDVLARFGYLTPRQEAAVLRVAVQERERAREQHIAAPVTTGRVTITGIVQTVTERDTPYGGVTKMRLRVGPVEACWFAWGTMPGGAMAGCREAFANGAGNCRDPIAPLRDYWVGRTVILKVTLSAGPEPHLAWFSRPTFIEDVTPAAATTENGAG